MNGWEHVTKQMKNLDDETREDCFCEAVKDHVDIHVEVKHYERLEDEPDAEKAKDRCFEHLWVACSRAVRRKRQNAVRDAHVAHLDAVVKGKPQKVAPSPKKRSDSRQRKGNEGDEGAAGTKSDTPCTFLGGGKMRQRR